MSYKDIKYGVVSSNEFQINRTELRARLGYDFDEAEIEQYIEKIKECANFRYAYSVLPLIIEDSMCSIGFTTVNSHSLAQVLHGCESAIILAVSAGIDVDRLITRAYYKSASEGFIFDAVASAYIDSFADYVDQMICTNLTTTTRFSPGYADFPLEFQTSLLERLDSKNTVGINLNDKLLMIPMKSITAVIGIK